MKRVDRRGVRRLLPVIFAAVLVATPAVAVAAPSSAQSPGAFPETVALPDGFEPEGITSGPGTTAYVGSLVDGAIWRGDLRSGHGQVFVAGETGRVAVGIDVDAGANQLWVAGGPTGTVTAYDTRSGAELARYEVPDAGFLNDVAVTPEAVYVTDSNVPHLVTIPLGPGGSPPESGELRTVPLTGDISYQEGFNANGIETLPGGGLVIVQSNTATLFEVEPATGQTAALPVVRGELSGGDGLERFGRTLFVVRGGGGDDVAALRLHPRPRAGELRFQAEFRGLRRAPSLDVPSTATVAAGRLWAVNARFSTPPTPNTEYVVTRLPLHER